MRKSFISLCLMALCFIIMASTAGAVATCGVAPLGTGNVLTIGTCTIGGLTFSNLQVINASSGVGTAEVDLTTATLNAGVVDLNFNPNLGTGTIGGTINDLHFAFTVAGVVTGDGITNSGTGSAIQEQACNVATGLGGGCPSPGNLLWNTVSLDGQTGSCIGNVASGTDVTNGPCQFGSLAQAAGPVQQWIFKDIGISNPATSHLSSFDETFGGATSVPEPMTLTLMGMGLLGVGFLGRRLKK